MPSHDGPALALLAAGAVFALAACTQPEVRLHSPGAYPESLSAWGVLQVRGNRLVLGHGVTPYDVNTPLFMDHALKLRTVWMPEDTRARFVSHSRYDLPVGTVLSKSFFYPLRAGVAQTAAGWDGDVDRFDLGSVHLVETRLLVRQSSGWDALPYVWRGDDAYLSPTGAIERFDLAVDGVTAPLDYVVPTGNECASCHATTAAREILPLGISTRQLNRGYHGAAPNQLAAWRGRGLLNGLPDPADWPRNADWQLGGVEPSAGEHEGLAPRKTSTEHLARSYLDANCGHCHNPESVVDTTGLWLDHGAHALRRMGACKPPIAAGRGTGGRRYSIVPGEPEASILTFRMAATHPSERMPELGRTLVDRRAVDIVARWITALPGTCG